MLKEEFLSKLEKRLLGIPKEDLERTLDYYNEIISDKVEDGMSEEEALVFRVTKGENGEDNFEIEIDESIINAVYDEYLKLLSDIPKN